MQSDAEHLERNDDFPYIYVMREIRGGTAGHAHVMEGERKKHESGYFKFGFGLV